MINLIKSLKNVVYMWKLWLDIRANVIWAWFGFIFVLCYTSWTLWFRMWNCTHSGPKDSSISSTIWLLVIVFNQALDNRMKLTTFYQIPLMMGHLAKFSRKFNTTIRMRSVCWFLNSRSINVWYKPLCKPII